jgi:hypothetical protein
MLLDAVQPDDPYRSGATLKAVAAALRSKRRVRRLCQGRSPAGELLRHGNSATASALDRRHRRPFCHAKPASGFATPAAASGGKEPPSQVVVAENARLLIFGPLLAGLAALGIAFIIPPTFTATSRILPPQQQGEVG